MSTTATAACSQRMSARGQEQAKRDKQEELEEGVEDRDRETKVCLN